MNDNIGLFQKKSKKQLLRTWNFLLPLKKQNLEIPGVKKNNTEFPLFLAMEILMGVVIQFCGIS